MGGGERPTGGEAIPAWDNPATAMLTLTASSVPSGDRLSPVDHLDAIHDAFSYGGVRDTLRNTMEYHLGLDSDDWGYWLQGEPHGMGTASDDDKRSGPNACYTHLHVGVYFDAGVTPLDLNSVGSEFERVIDKHVEECDPAGFAGHNYTEIDDYLREEDGCISLNADVENLGSYMAAYMGGYTESLLDKPIEYIAWGALYWSAARRRTSRSKLVNESIRADRCHQRYESEAANQSRSHGEHIRWNEGRGLDVVCSCCGSGWNIDQTRLDEPPTDEQLNDALPDKPEPDERPDDLASRWPTADAGWSIGETHQEAVIRDRVLTYLDVNGSDVSVPALMGHLNINPTWREFVEKITDGQTSTPSESFERETVDEDYRLKAIVEKDGTEHSPGSGGVDLVSLELPEVRVLEQTRLQYKLKSGEKFRCEKCNLATHNPNVMGTHLIEHGVETVRHAEYLLSVDDYHEHERACMESPVDVPVGATD